MKDNALNSRHKTRKLRDNFSWNACRLFNALPRSLRDVTNCSVEMFKTQLDKYLQTVPDEPHITGMTMYRRAESNSIIDMNNI